MPFSRIKDFLLAIGPIALIFVTGLYIGYRYVDPAPPSHLVISTGTDEGDYQTYAQQYREIIKADNVTLELRPSTGAVENLKRLNDPNSDVQAAFVQDGLGSVDDSPDLSSLGSLYYEPLWIFYRGNRPIGHLSQLMHSRVGLGAHGGGTTILSRRLLKTAGLNDSNTHLSEVGWDDAAKMLRHNQLDAAFFIATPEDPLIKNLVHDRTLHLMSMDQAEGITRHFSYLHHLVLPRGSLDLAQDIPNRDVDLVSVTATLLVRDSIHPALIYLLMKAATLVHGEPGILEHKKEFPVDKDDSFPLSDEAERFYKSGGRFWQRYLPFWLATLVDRFMFVLLPLVVFILPLVRMVPQFLNWRMRTRIYKHYGELKFLETQLRSHPARANRVEDLKRLDAIEERVNRLKVPLNFTEHVYGLREHIHFVRQRLDSLTPPPQV